MPEVSTLRTRENLASSDDAPIVEPYDFKLYLPSTLPTNVLCSPQLREFEYNLREAQAFADSAEPHANDVPGAGWTSRYRRYG